jgi:arylsulfatase A-like enzyme
MNRLMIYKWKWIGVVGLLAGFIATVLILYRRPERAVLLPIKRVVLVTVDALRADHLGCYGYLRPTSPFIDELASRSVVFTRAFCQYPLTVPSLSSLLTSFYPLQFNLVENFFRLDASFLTIAEFMRGQGYRTAAFVSVKRIFPGANLDQGFETFAEPVSTSESLHYLRAEGMIDGVLAWLGQWQPDDRFFIWIHLFDPHAPYYPPRKYYDIFAEAGDEEAENILRHLETREINMDLIDRLTSHEIGLKLLVDNYHRGEKGVAEAALLKLINAYDGEIRYMDHELGRLYEQCEKSGLNQDTLWIVTGDHGQGLGQHDWIDHQVRIYNEAIHVPLIFHFASGTVPAGRENTPVELVDIFPTVADLLGEGESKEAEQLQGRTLVPFFSAGGKSTFTERPLQGFAFSQRALMGDREEFQELWDPGKLFSLQDSNYKYLYRTEGDPEFYDLQADWCETDNLAGEGGEAEENLREKIIAKIRCLEKTRQASAAEPVDEKMREALRELGYQVP